jgi:hypothetical protein
VREQLQDLLAGGGWGPLDGTGVPISQLRGDLFLTLGCKARVITVFLLHLPDSNKGDFEGPASSVGQCIRIKVHSTDVKYTVFCRRTLYAAILELGFYIFHKTKLSVVMDRSVIMTLSVV